MKTKSFTILSEKEKDWTYSIRCSIQENGTFHHRGIFTDFYKRKEKKPKVLHQYKYFTLFSFIEERWRHFIECVIQEDGKIRKRGNFHGPQKIDILRNKRGEGRNLERKKAHFKKFCKENPEKIRASQRKYNQSEKGKISLRKRENKRRGLAFIELNNQFRGSDAHHIDKEFVLWIPKDLHHSISHNIWTGYNMEKINNKAIEWAYGV